MPKIVKDGEVLAVFPLEQLDSWLVESGLSAEDVDIVLTPKEARTALRQALERQSGDILSMFGKANDEIGLLLAWCLGEIIVTGEHPSNDADRRRFDMLMAMTGLDREALLALANAEHDKLQNGTYRLSAPAKPGGVAGAINDGLQAQTDFVNLLTQMKGA
jgi:hypothetical protein